MTTGPTAKADTGTPAPGGRELKPRFEYLPVGLFGAVMGLVGLGIAWHLAASRYGITTVIGDAIGWTAFTAFCVLALAYGAKAITSFPTVRAEFGHPIAGNLFGTPLISLLLLPFVLVKVSPVLAELSWIAGTMGMIVFAFVIVSRWMGSRQQIAHATPAWIIPVVGLLDIPLAVPSLALPHTHGVMIFALGIGLFFAVPLFTLIFSRLLFEEPLPAALRPTLMILVAPFMVGFSSYVATTGRIDGFAEALFMIGLFILAVVGGHLRDLVACCPFRFSWWAVSFPLSASSVAALRYAGHVEAYATDAIAIALLVLATLVIAALTGRTLVGIVRGELRILSS